MKNIIIAIMFSFFAFFANAEPSFNQIQTLIASQEYRAAEKGLEEIIANHPKSAKAFYAMAQAQAGLGNLTKAQHALDKAMGLNPTLDFAPQSSVENLKQAIHPQVAKIEVIEESHFGRNVLLIILFISTLGVGYYFYSENEKNKQAKLKALEDTRKAREKAEFERIKNLNDKPVQKVKAYSKPTETMIAPGGGLADVKPVAAAPVTPTPVQQPVVVNTTTNNSTNDMLMGAMLGHMVTNAMHNSSSSHKEVVREREVIREAAANDSSWDDKPRCRPWWNQDGPGTRSSSWDDAPSSSSSRSSSWDSDSSSSRSSSWSSSSDSSSSSSWDSSSSDSGSSSSSWD